jgi:hypothetical protein
MNLTGSWLELWSSAWPYLVFLAGFISKLGLDKWAEYKVSKSVEGYRADLRKKEAILNDAMKAQRDEIAALRSSVLGGMTARSGAVSQRKLVAVDRLWAAVVDLNRYIIVTRMMSPIKVEEAIKTSSLGNDEAQRIRSFADMVWRTCGLGDMKPPPVLPDNERPFLTETAWARFSLYRSVMTLPIFHLAAMKSGMKPDYIKSPQPLFDAAKAALPHYSQFIDDHGLAALPELLEEIRDLVLQEARNIIAGSSVEADLETASKIIAATRKFDETTSSSLGDPPHRAPAAQH